MNYIDGFVAAVPTAKKAVYQRHCQDMGAVFKEHGALAVVDAWGDDVPEGKLTSFTMAVNREPDEAVVFGWIVWPSREVRDAAWTAVMADPRMKDQAPPFDGKRMIYGGFQTIAQS
jgi:uncharacterized protein YbaA (DUF1428 family)